MNLQNPRLVLVAIGLLFFTPLLLAILMRAEWWDFKPEHLSNRGRLVQPPLSLPGDSAEMLLAGTEGEPWIILFTFSGECEVACQEAVTGLRQVHLALGRDRHKVQINLLAPVPVVAGVSEKLAAIYPEFRVSQDSVKGIYTVLAQIQGAPDLQYGQAFLLDPAGNIILHYFQGFDPNDINKDLERLLAWTGKD